MWPFTSSNKAVENPSTTAPNTNADENDDLTELWKIFKDSPEEIQARRKQVTTIINENTAASFPSEISIMTAFDELTGCFSLGNQMKNYYRYGEYDDCKRQREKFWFAIRNGSFSDGGDPYQVTDETLTKPREIKRRQKIQEFFKARLLEDKARGSSEDIWHVRDTPKTDLFDK